MEVKVECSGCRKEMTITSTYSHTALSEVIIEVAPCACSQPDCSECEDIVLYREREAKLAKLVRKLQLQLKGARV